MVPGEDEPADVSVSLHMFLTIDFNIILYVFLLFIIVIIVLEISTWSLLIRFNGDIQYLFSEFPDIDRNLFEGYQSFDSELGWVRPPNENREKNVIELHPDNEPDTNPVSLTTDEYGSRVCQFNRDTGEFSIATYGDSYCFGWEVNDDETFQHYLSQKLGVHVSNYGVGNYGVDQSLIRLERRFNDDPADYVVIALCDKYAIERICSVWLHYIQLDNPLAVKPRFRSVGNELEKVPIPINKKTQLLALEEHKEYLRANDYHYINYFDKWFSRHKITFPYTAYWLRSRYNLPHAVTTVSAYFLDGHSHLMPVKRQLSDFKARIEQKKGSPYSVPVDEKWAYRRHLEKEFTDLFCAELKRFSSFVRAQGATPIFVPMQHNAKFHYDFDIDPLGDSVIDNIENECSMLHICDRREDIAESVDDINTLYVRKGTPGGHLSPTGNEMYAKYLSNFIRELSD